MSQSTAHDLASFISELNQETDRGLPLVALALIDDRLMETLRAFFCEGPSASKLLDEGQAVLGTLSARNEACYALGLIDSFEHKQITALRKIRNEFAHAKHGITFKSPRVQGLCSGLEVEDVLNGVYPANEPRARFVQAAVNMVMRLYFRPEWVMAERRKIKSWVSADDLRWRNVETDPPPEGEPVMVIGKTIGVARHVLKK